MASSAAIVCPMAAAPLSKQAGCCSCFTISLAQHGIAHALQPFALMLLLSPQAAARLAVPLPAGLTLLICLRVGMRFASAAAHSPIFDTSAACLQLEWVEGEIWANVWLTECIARIDPATGRVK